MAILKKNDLIYLLIASSPTTNFDKLNNFVTYLESLGLRVKLGKSLYFEGSIVSGDDRSRAKDLMDAFIDADVKAIFCYKGGYGAQRILPYLDYEQIKRSPKPILGYSDVTVLLNVLSSKCDVPCFHANMGVSINDETDKYLFEDFIFGEFNHLKNQKLPLTVINEGKASGTLVGGCLSLIYALQGTPYEIDFSDKILFLEDVHEASYAIDRMLSSLELAGAFKKIKGLLVGHFNPDTEADDIELIKRVVKDLDIPVIYGLEAGHVHPNQVLPIGKEVEFNTKDQIIWFKD